MWRKTVLLAGMLTGATACSSTSPARPSGPLSVQINLAPGQAAWVDQGALRLQFRGVLSDSRCPADALCVWAGDALVRIEAHSTGGQTTPFDFHTNPALPVRHEDVTITLLELSPYPSGGRRIDPDEYRARLSVTR